MESLPLTLGGGWRMWERWGITGWPAWAGTRRVKVTSKREIALEQAAAALLSEVKAAGFDPAEIAGKAKAGITGNAMYTWVSDQEIKANAIEAVDYLLGAVKPPK